MDESEKFIIGAIIGRTMARGITANEILAFVETSFAQVAFSGSMPIISTIF